MTDIHLNPKCGAVFRGYYYIGCGNQVTGSIISEPEANLKNRRFLIGPKPRFAARTGGERPISILLRKAPQQSMASPGSAPSWGSRDSR